MEPESSLQFSQELANFKRVRFPVGGWNFSLHHRIQNGSGAHPASYPMSTRGCFPGCKAAGA
jgi:hypothetical protein